MTPQRTAKQLVKHWGRFANGPPTDAVVARLAEDYLTLRELIRDWFSGYIDAEHELRRIAREEK